MFSHSSWRVKRMEDNTGQQKEIINYKYTSTRREINFHEFFSVDSSLLEVKTARVSNSSNIEIYNTLLGNTRPKIRQNIFVSFIHSRR